MSDVFLDEVALNGRLNSSALSNDIAAERPETESNDVNARLTPNIAERIIEEQYGFYVKYLKLAYRSECENRAAFKVIARDRAMIVRELMEWLTSAKTPVEPTV